MKIREFLNSIQGNYPFHMPGHKRNPEYAGAYAEWDITEIHGADNLLAPTGIIRGLQEKLAALYGADESFILVNGSTVGIEAAILYCGEAGIIMARNSHRSAYGGLILSGGVPEYIYPELDDNGIAGIIAPQAVEYALKIRPDAAAVFITSPTFEGYCSDIAKIVEIVHAHGKLLIVDEAHGAHLGFHPGFPQNASRLGADIVIQSLHKTLPAPGQCSVMHVSGANVDAKKLKACVNILQTSSPSYFFMAEIERCAELLLNGEKIFADYYARLTRFREEMSELKNISLLEPLDSGFDPGKLTFITKGLTGVEFGSRLRRRGVELEMCSVAHAIAMTSAADTDEGFERLLEACKQIENDIYESQTQIKNFESNFRNVSRGKTPRSFPPRELTPREAFFKNKRVIATKDAAGLISGDFIIPYPPGIPLVAPGEAVTEEILREVEHLLQAGADVLGAAEIAVIVKSAS